MLRQCENVGRFYAGTLAFVEGLEFRTNSQPTHAHTQENTYGHSAEKYEHILEKHGCSCMHSEAPLVTASLSIQSGVFPQLG